MLGQQWFSSEWHAHPHALAVTKVVSAEHGFEHLHCLSVTSLLVTQNHCEHQGPTELQNMRKWVEVQQLNACCRHPK